MKKTILFDLDGTLTDSQEGILKSIKFALEHFGYDVPDEESMLEEWETLFQKFNIDIADEYTKQVDFLNNDRPVYTYNIQQYSIK